MEQEVSQEYTEDDLEVVSINFNKNCSMLTPKLEIYVGNNNMVIPYKIDTGNDRNIMPWYIFEKFFPGVIEYQLAKTTKNHIKLDIQQNIHNPARDMLSDNRI